MTAERDRAERSRTDVPVLIVGAGPTGLVLALWLTKFGVPVRIIDKTAEPGTTSRALAVSARTLEFYRQLGVADPLVEGGVKAPGANFWVQGTQVARLPLDRIGEGLTPFPFALIFPQDAHERVLIERLEALGVTVERRTELVRFAPRGDGVRATLRRADGAEEICEASYLAGCDGAHSTVREALAIGFPGGTYAAIFFVADVEGSGPATNGEIHVDLGRSDFLAVFPLKGTGRVRLVGTVLERPAGAHGDWTFDDVRDRVLGHLKFTIGQVNWFSTYHVHHRVAAKFREGRAFLLGDAAHVHSPVGGQGMNTGIGDAVNLAWKLAAVLNGGAADSLLDTYEPERIGFARRLVATTDRAFTMVTAQGPIAWRVRTRLVPLVVPFLFRLAAVRRFLFRTVSQIGVNYRDSPLSEGAAGSVRGGDRLPWVETAPDEDNFAPLTALAWQVHVYGEPPRGVAEACGELGLPLDLFAWQPEMRRSGLMRGALYLVRPDGYVALADPDGDPERLGRYFLSRGLSATLRRDEATRVDRPPVSPGSPGGGGATSAARRPWPRSG
jgi:2-polyprenyl-6-methoxyphenol hydroxylase-like FAD-dependent oxidoreductase